VVQKGEDEKVAAVSRQYEEARLGYEEARRRKEEAVRRVDRTREAIERLTPSRMLSDFLQDRLASQDYRQHLGVMAKIRDDFERLSNYVCPEAPRPESIGIDRIVLYIDDLDRCPPEKVVRVLEAVHLLLAFRLFVVVVGVDARWIAHALKTYYSTVLADGKDKEPRVDSVFGEAATPHDYLEKIFQVPFWLAPMGEVGCKAMLDKLLEEPAPPAPTIAKKPAADVEREAMPREVEQPIASASAGAQVEENGEPAAEAYEESPPTRGEEEEKETEAKAARRLRRMEIGEAEKTFMSDLAPLLHRSPRALKRFVNVYRLIKVSLRPGEQEEYQDASMAPPRHEIVLFLLAVTVGMPVVSQAFFDAIARATDDVPDEEPPPGDLAALLLGMQQATSPARKHAEIAYQADLLRLARWRDERAKTSPFNPTLAELGKWSRRVTRFSYRVNPW
jgi:hypothetical protein